MLLSVSATSINGKSMSSYLQKKSFLLNWNKGSEQRNGRNVQSVVIVSGRMKDNNGVSTGRENAIAPANS